MKTIGLIGGMSWQSTETYYRILNTEVHARLGGFHSAQCILHSVDFHEIEECQMKGDWDRTADILGAAAAGLERAGADFVVLCTNTMHKVAPAIQERISLPLLHIADATADALLRQGVRTAGLLGTRYTMEQDFYISRLRERGLAVQTPDAGDRARINAIIFDELCLGAVRPQSKQFYLSVVEKLREAGAEAVILGCTEIGLLISDGEAALPLYDTTKIHAEAAVEFALSQ